MGKSSLRYAMLLIAAMTAPAVTHADEAWTGNVNFSLGNKSLDKDDWAPVEDQGEFGISADFRKQDWPTSIVVGLYGSGDDGKFDDGGHNFKIEVNTSEFRVGAKKDWSPTDAMHPFFSGGIAGIGVKVKLKTQGLSNSEDDSALGWWLNGGITWLIGTSFNLGFELGYSKAEVTIADYDAQAGGGHAAVVLGYHWQ
jgi:opacity protein-like surface antigen